MKNVQKIVPILEFKSNRFSFDIEFDSISV